MQRWKNRAGHTSGPSPCTHPAVTKLTFGSLSLAPLPQAGVV